MNNREPTECQPSVTRVSYAQNMEDILLDRFFMDQRGTYMDVGANHPVNDSNTYFFYLRGWRGVNLEPIPRLHELFQQHRPADLNLAVAASNKEMALPFYEISACDGLSTLSSDVAADHRRRGLQVNEYQVSARKIASLVQEHGLTPPDILSIDVEGHEAQVIEGIPLSAWRPKVLVIESTLPMSHMASHKSWESILFEHDYVFAAFNGINRFYLRGDLREKLNVFETPVNVLDNYRRADVVAMEERARRVEKARAEETAQFEQLRAAWDWGRQQTEAAQLAWQQSRADWDRERNAWREERASFEETLARHQRQAQDFTGQFQAHERTLAEFRQALQDKEKQVRQWQVKVQLMNDRELELREMLLDAHDQLLRRDDDIQSTLAGLLASGASEAGPGQQNGPVVTGAIAARKSPAQRSQVPSDYLRYQVLVRQVRQHVCQSVPHGATVAVINKGDDHLLQLEGRRGWHFPQEADGTYVGHNPASGAEAVAQLESVRNKGADFLVIPATAFWWLEHYEEFRRHLALNYHEVEPNDGVCMIFALRGPAVDKQQEYQQLIHRMRSVADINLPAQAKVLVVGKGDEECLRLGQRRGGHFPQQEDGTYAGHYPADSAAAIAHLEALRAKGFSYLLLPSTAYWWLDHYADFRKHLDSRYQVLVRQDDACIIYALAGAAEANGHCRITNSTAALVEGKPFGVNVTGTIASEKGTGEAVRATIRSLEAAHIPFVLNNFVDVLAVNADTAFTQFSADNPYSVNLIQLNADAVDWFVQKKGAAYLHGRYNIGYWFWELSDFPEEWRSAFQYFDEIWTGSNFALDAISRAAPVPVIRIPVCLPQNLAMSGHARAHFGLPRHQFIFLFIFDFMSFMERKNPLGLIKAFKQAFGHKDDVTLVLKCSHSEACPENLQALTRAARGANVKILDDVLSREELNSLMGLCDCYVSLHRSEGFGITMAEAMSLGKPVIATAFSGNIDFMTGCNSFPVNYELVEIKQDHGPYKKGWLWAEPDVNHAAELMRKVYENKGLAKRVGRKARRDVLQTLDPLAVGRLIGKRLRVIAASGRIASPPQATDGPILDLAAETRTAPEDKNAYHQRLERIRAVVDADIATDATILVVSKGDDELLRLEGRRAWHFPQREDGVYAGYYPADSGAAIAHLEELRDKGANYLLFPDTSLWWLEHYVEFQQHLDHNYRRVRWDQTCLLFDLAPARARLDGGKRAAGAQKSASTKGRMA